MHAVKDAKWKSNIDNSSPHAEIVEIHFSVVVKLGTSTKCRHDPQLSKTETRTGRVFGEFSNSKCERARENGTHYDVSQQ